MPSPLCKKTTYFFTSQKCMTKMTEYIFVYSLNNDGWFLWNLLICCLNNEFSEQPQRYRIMKASSSLVYWVKSHSNYSLLAVPSTYPPSSQVLVSFWRLRILKRLAEVAAPLLRNHLCFGFPAKEIEIFFPIIGEPLQLFGKFLCRGEVIDVNVRTLRGNGWIVRSSHHNWHNVHA